MAKEKHEKNHSGLSHYPKDSAARLMTERVPVVALEAHVLDIESLLLKKAADFASINYIYVVDARKKLKGVVSIKELFRQAKDFPVRQIMVRQVVSVRTHTDQERVAIVALHHSLKAVPVVDKQDTFLGAITSDTILSILHKESVEDFLRSAGIGPNGATNIFAASAWFHVRKRLPWLLFGLFGGLIAAGVVSFFETALKAHLLLAAFIPTVVYMADAVGSQTQTIFIRYLAIEHKPKMSLYFLREIKVSFFLAFLLALIVSVTAWLWFSQVLLGLILSLSLFATILAATTVAVFLPWLFLKLKFDPAIASGPFATIIRDLSSLLIYFFIAQALLNFSA